MNESENSNKYLNNENEIIETDELKERNTMNEFENNSEPIKSNNINEQQEKNITEHQNSDYGYRVYNSVGSSVNNISDENNLSSVNNMNTQNNGTPNYSIPVDNNKTPEAQDIPTIYNQSQTQYDYMGNNPQLDLLR